MKMYRGFVCSHCGERLEYEEVHLINHLKYYRDVEHMKVYSYKSNMSREIELCDKCYQELHNFIDSYAVYKEKKEGCKT